MKSDETKQTAIMNAGTQSVFEQIRRLDEHGMEFWSARDMAKALEYSEYRHFLPVIEKAKDACKNSKQRLSDHFEDILELIKTSPKRLTP